MVYSTSSGPTTQSTTIKLSGEVIKTGRCTIETPESFCQSWYWTPGAVEYQIDVRKCCPTPQVLINLYVNLLITSPNDIPIGELNVDRLIFADYAVTLAVSAQVLQDNLVESKSGAIDGSFLCISASVDLLCLIQNKMWAILTLVLLC